MPDIWKRTLTMHAVGILCTDCAALAPRYKNVGQSKNRHAAWQAVKLFAIDMGNNKSLFMSVCPSYILSFTALLHCSTDPFLHAKLTSKYYKCALLSSGIWRRARWYTSTKLSEKRATWRWWWWWSSSSSSSSRNSNIVAVRWSGPSQRESSNRLHLPPTSPVPFGFQSTTFWQFSYLRSPFFFQSGPSFRISIKILQVQFARSNHPDFIKIFMLLKK